MGSGYWAWSGQSDYKINMIKGPSFVNRNNSINFLVARNLKLCGVMRKNNVLFHRTRKKLEKAIH